MKATGIVRRIDDLGRVVIPKEIRRTMGIKDGDPLELYTEGKFICFKKYMVERNWEKAKAVVAAILNTQMTADEYEFALYNEDFNRMVATSSTFDKDGSTIDSPFIHEIKLNGECIGWLAVNQDDNTAMFDDVAKIIAEVLKVEGE